MEPLVALFVVLAIFGGYLAIALVIRQSQGNGWFLVFMAFGPWIYLIARRLTRGSRQQENLTNP